MVLLRPALRSTAFGRGLSCGGPSIPLPQTRSVEPNTARPSFGGLWRVGGLALCSASPQETMFGAIRRIEVQTYVWCRGSTPSLQVTELLRRGGNALPPKPSTPLEAVRWRPTDTLT